MRVVEGDTLEIMFTGISDAKRIPLNWLVVQAHPSRKNNFQVQIGSSNVEQPLYSTAKKPEIKGQSFIMPIRGEEEPEIKAFFTEVANFCGRTVAD